MTSISTASASSDTAAMRALGSALTVLRTRAQMTQAEAGAAIGATHQGWAKYENGRAPSIFKPSVQDRLAVAVRSTRDELLAEVGRLTAPPERPADEDWQARSFLDVGEAP